VNPDSFKALAEQVAIPFRHLRFLLEQIEFYIPGATVWAFGSRVKWSHREQSDLDLAVLCDKQTAQKVLPKLNDAFIESDLPFKVQLLDFNRLPANMQENIKKDYIVLYRPQETPLPPGWKETTLGEVAELAREQWLPGDPGHKYIGLEHINQDDLQINGFGLSSSLRSNKFYFKQGDILFGKLRPYFRKVWQASFDGVCSTDIWVIRAKEGYDQNYLFYFMANPVLIDKSTGASTGTKMPRADWDFLKGTEWLTPPLPEQKAIAAVLSSFDDKIELLRRQNKTLEKIAQTIFKEWFVNFNFPDEKGKPYKNSGGRMKSSELGEIPDGCRVGTLGEELSVSIGGDWGQGTKGSDGYVQAYCLRGTDIDSLKISGYSAQVPLRWIKKDSLKKRIITENDVLIGGSGLGPIGKTLYCHKNINLLYDFPITYSNFCKRLTAKNKYHALYFEYLISRLYSQGSLERFFTGTSIPNLDINGLLEEIVVIPNEKQIEDFAKIIDLKYSNLINPQIQTLSKLRDTLLPKLLKGEIRVKL